MDGKKKNEMKTKREYFLSLGKKLAVKYLLLKNSPFGYPLRKTQKLVE